MQFFTTTALLSALLALASANTVTFQNQDSVARTVKFTPSAGKAAIPDIHLSASSPSGKATFPTGWIGNWYAIKDGSADSPGMLGEVAFDGFKGATYFDVSAIVDPNDHNGVKELFPAVSKTPMSGCQTFPCANAYNLPDDIQTLSTQEKDLVCLIGSKTTARRHAREFVTSASPATTMEME